MQNDKLYPKLGDAPLGVIRAVYDALLGRDPDEEGAAFYGRLLDDEGIATGMSNMLSSVTGSAEFQKIWRTRVGRQFGQDSDVGSRQVSGQPVSHVLSLGCDCTAAFITKGGGYKRYSLPFDWIFSSPKMIIDCLQDDFARLLDPKYFRSISERRKNGEAGAEHVFFLEKYGIEEVFAHRDPTRPDHYAYLTRCVLRMRSLLADDAAKVFFMVCKSGDPELGDMFGEVVNALGRTTRNAELIAVQLHDPPAGNVQRSLTAARSIGGSVLYDFVPASDMDGLGYFPDPVDELTLIRLLAQYQVDLKDPPGGSKPSDAGQVPRIGIADEKRASSSRPAEMAPLSSDEMPLHQKNERASEVMLPSDGNSYYCRWIEDSMTIHSDGNVTCGLDDLHGSRSFGNVANESVENIFANPEYRRIQEKLRQGYRCHPCSLYESSDSRHTAPTGRAKKPSVLVIEPTIKCNLRCPQQACIPNNLPGLKTRTSAYLAVDEVANVVDQVSDELRQVYFFNYGDPFVHRGAESMLAHIQRSAPSAEVITSTNGIPLKKYERAEAVVAAGLSHITFTISGMTQESYSRYHVGGKLEDALAGLRNVAEAKRRLGRKDTEIVWRYLLFKWNDSDAEVEAAVALAASLGVRLALYLTQVPDGAASWRFSPGTPNYLRYRSIIASAHGFAGGVPDGDGFYPLENVEGLGPARWTTFRARRTVHPIGGALQIALSTNRPEPSHQVAKVSVPWGKAVIDIERLNWKEVIFSVPDEYRGDSPIEVRIDVLDPWWPAEVIETADTRYLGVLVREPSVETELMETADWEPWVPVAALDPDHGARISTMETQS